MGGDAAACASTRSHRPPFANSIAALAPEPRSRSPHPSSLPRSPTSQHLKQVRHADPLFRGHSQKTETVSDASCEGPLSCRRSPRCLPIVVVEEEYPYLPRKGDDDCLQVHTLPL